MLILQIIDYLVHSEILNLILHFILLLILCIHYFLKIYLGLI